MPSASFELQKAIYQSLITDTSLTTLLGGARIYDHVPRAAAEPYITVGPSSVRDWSTATEPGEEHVLTLNVYSGASGYRQAHEILAALRERLNDAGLSLDGHRLVNLRHELSEVRRSAGGGEYRATARFRAVTEPA